MKSIRRNKKSLFLIIVLFLSIIISIVSLFFISIKKIKIKPNVSVLNNSITNYFPFYNYQYFETQFIKDVVDSSKEVFNQNDKILFDFYFENTKIKIVVNYRKNDYIFYYDLIKK